MSARIQVRSFSRVYKKFFSLIELLIVVAIIAILVSILQPILTSAMDNAKFLHCTNNMKQLFQGQSFYSDDNLRFPNFSQWVVGQWWHDGAVENGSLYPYINKKETYSCPTFDSVLEDMPNNNGGEIIPGIRYVMNDQMRNYEFSYCMSEGAHNEKPTDIFNPSEMALLAEENPYIMIGLTNYQLNDGRILVVKKPQIVDTLASFHAAGADSGVLPVSGYSNILYVDGHVSIGSFDESYERLFDSDWIPKGSR